MKKFLNYMPLMAFVVMMSLVCSCGNKNNADMIDYDADIVNSGEYVFDATLVDAALENLQTTFKIIVNGRNVTIPDGERVMTGKIDDAFHIHVIYDPGDNLHYWEMDLDPTDKKGKKWKGDYFFSRAIHYDVTLEQKQ